MTDNQYPTFWITGYLPNGCKVSYTVPIEGDPYGEALRFTDTLLSHGFSTHDPGLEAGATKEKLGYVVLRSTKAGKNVIDLYVDHEKMVNRTVMIYPNEDESIAIFEKATGLRINALPLCDADRINRSDAKAAKYVVKVPNQVYFIYKPNPNHDPNEKDITKMKPARLFQRFETDSGIVTVDTPKNEPEAPKEPFSSTSSIDDKDIAWVTNKTVVNDLFTAVIAYFAQQRIRVKPEDIFGAINIVTHQSAARFSELVNITQADAWAACLIHMCNGDKSKALAQVKDDPILTKAVTFWTDTVSNVDFMS